MRILAIDSSGLVASVAIIEDNIMIAEYTVNYKKTHSQTLLPMIDEIVSMVEIDLNTIDAIAISGGPGSFTGLRIGSSTAKGLGLALKKPIINIPTLDGIAFNLYGTDKIICPLIDAKRNQVYTGIYEFVEDNFCVICEQKICLIDEIIDEINKINRKIIFLGDGAKVYKNEIDQKVKNIHYYAPTHLFEQRAGAIGTLAIKYFNEGKFETATEHIPIYLRLSQAERERLEKENNR